MLLVADTSPLISLMLIERLGLLDTLYPDFIIPGAVYAELTGHNELKRFETELLSLKTHVRNVDSGLLISIQNIDEGEKEAIALYQELHAGLLLIDDKKARDVAQSMNIKCIGTLTVLYQAKLNGLIPLLNPEFQQLKSKKRFYSEELFQFFLKKAGEGN